MSKLVLHFVISIGLLAVAACGNKAPAATSGGGQTAQSAADSAPVDVSDWQSWTKISEAPFRSEGHRSQWADVYVDADHADAYKAMSGPMPEGTKVAKLIYKADGDKAGDPAVLTIMVKMAPGYDPEHNDWYYGVYNADGSKAKKHGKIAGCYECHSNYEDTDYVSGVPKE